MTAFKNFTLKFPGMRKAQEFTIYPYSGGDTCLIQSETRIAEVNLRTGKMTLSKPRTGGAYFMHLNSFCGAYPEQMQQSDLIELQEYLWNNSGRQEESGLVIENKDLFSI